VRPEVEQDFQITGLDDPRSTPPPRLILASRSPQRRAILEQLGVAFLVHAPQVEELETGPPDEVAVENAYRKAAAVSAPPRGAVVLGVDTVVCIGGRMYGKPADAEEAREILRELAGRRHAVIGGICLMQDGEPRTAATTTLVEFRTFDRQLVERYVQSGEWRGRAGGYAIQGRGAALVAGIEGDYFNVVGLPVAALLDLAPRLLEMDYAGGSRGVHEAT
jgi:septum formation protein